MSWEEIQALELDPGEPDARGRGRGAGRAAAYRHGHNPGSVRLGGQRHPVRVPRVRGREVRHVRATPRLGRGALSEGAQCRDYEAAVEAVPGAIGLSRRVSREFKKATAARLKEFQERDLSVYDVVALVLDGKSFAEDEMVVALGVWGTA